MLDAAVRLDGKRFAVDANRDEIGRSLQALRCGAPELVWLGSSYSCGAFPASADSVVRLDYRMDAREARATLDEMARRTAPLIDALRAVPERMRRVQAAHHALVASVRYVDEHPYRYTADGPLVHGEGVCMGIALAYKYLLDRCDVPCLVACGQSRSNALDPASWGPHAWNMVRVEGGWTHVDVTSDLTISTDPSNPRLDYLGLSDSEIASSHVAEDRTLPSARYSLHAYDRLGYAVSTWEELEQLLARVLPGKGWLVFEASGPLRCDAREAASFLSRLANAASSSLRVGGCERSSFTVNGNADRGIYEIRLAR